MRILEIIQDNISQIRDYLTSRVMDKRGISAEKRKFMAQLIQDLEHSDRLNCPLSGRELTLSGYRSLHIDHIIPTSRIAEPLSNNLQLLSRDVNRAKTNLTMGEFLVICHLVVNYTKNNILNESKFIDFQVDFYIKAPNSEPELKTTIPFPGMTATKLSSKLGFADRKAVNSMIRNKAMKKLPDSIDPEIKQQLNNIPLENLYVFVRSTGESSSITTTDQKYKLAKMIPDEFGNLILDSNSIMFDSILNLNQALKINLIKARMPDRGVKIVHTKLGFSIIISPELDIKFPEKIEKSEFRSNKQNLKAIELSCDNGVCVPTNNIVTAPNQKQMTISLTGSDKNYGLIDKSLQGRPIQITDVNGNIRHWIVLSATESPKSEYQLDLLREVNVYVLVKRDGKYTPSSKFTTYNSIKQAYNKLLENYIISTDYVGLRDAIHGNKVISLIPNNNPKETIYIGLRFNTPDSNPELKWVLGSRLDTSILKLHKTILQTTNKNFNPMDPIISTFLSKYNRMQSNRNLAHKNQPTDDLLVDNDEINEDKELEIYAKLNLYDAWDTFEKSYNESAKSFCCGLTGLPFNTSYSNLRDYPLDSRLIKILDDEATDFREKALTIRDLKSGGVYANPFGPSPDQIVPHSKNKEELPYAPDNIEWVCTIVNLSKGDMSREEYIKLCQDVVTQYKSV